MLRSGKGVSSVKEYSRSMSVIGQYEVKVKEGKYQKVVKDWSLVLERVNGKGIYIIMV